MRSDPPTLEKSAPETSGVRQPREFTPQSVGVLIACVVGFYLGPSGLIMSTFTEMMQPMSRDLGWSRSQIAFLITLLAVSMAIGSPIKGYVFDRWGLRRVVLLLTLLLATATAALSQVHGNAFAIYGLFVAIGLLTPGNLPYGKLIAEWFRERRGMAYGVYGLGIAASLPLGLQLARLSVDSLGWRTTFMLYAALQLLVAAPLIWLFFHERYISDQPGTSEEVKETIGVSPAEAGRSAAFWLVVINLGLGIFVFAGLSTHGIAMLTDIGLTRKAATNALSALQIGAVFAQPLMGYLMDRIHSAKVAIPFGLAALVGLVIVQTIDNPTWRLVGFVILGLGAGGEVSTTPYFVSRFFGLRNFSVIYGSIQPFTLAFAVGLGSYVIGLLYDRTGSYRLDLLIMDAALLLAPMLLLLLGPYRFAAGPSGPHRQSSLNTDKAGASS